MDEERHLAIVQQSNRLGKNRHQSQALLLWDRTILAGARPACRGHFAFLENPLDSARLFPFGPTGTGGP